MYDKITSHDSCKDSFQHTDHLGHRLDFRFFYVSPNLVYRLVVMVIDVEVPK
jgi:hypothetical protein